MDYVRTIESVLAALRELLAVVSRQMNSGNEDTFLHRVYRFLQSITATIERDQVSRKQLNDMLKRVLSTAGLIAQVLSSNAVFNAVLWVRREVGGLFEGRIPENVARSYQELQRLMDAASARMTDIEASCSQLMEQVQTACERYCCTPQTVHSLETQRVRILVDIRDCEQTLETARRIIEQLRDRAIEGVVRYGVGLAVLAVATLGIGFGAAKAFQAGARLKGGTLGVAGVGGAVLCFMIAKKLGDYKIVWDEMNITRDRYHQISNRLESLKAVVQIEMQTLLPSTMTCELIPLLLACGTVLAAYIVYLLLGRGQTV